MKILKYILVVSIFTGSVYSDCLFCSVTPVEWNIHMASNETYDEIKKKEKEEG